jgi:hypothetical protein
MKIFLAILLPVAFIGAQPQSPSTEKQDPQPYSIAEAYEVYSTILPDDWNKSQSTKLVIAQETRSYGMCLAPDNEQSKKTVDPAIADYVAQNKKAWLLQWDLQIAMPYQLVPHATLDAFFQKGGTGWAGVQKTYPQSSGWIEVSAIGFDPDKTVAVVYEGHHCGVLCGGGRFYTLQKKDGKWLPLDWSGTSCAWAS